MNRQSKGRRKAHGAGAKETADTLRKKLLEQAVECIEAGTTPRVFVDFAGSTVAARIARRGLDNLWVEIAAEEVPLPWGSFSAKRLSGVFHKVLSPDPIIHFGLASRAFACKSPTKRVTLSNRRQP